MKEHLVYRLVISFLLAFYSGLPGLWIAEVLMKKETGLFYAIKNFELTKKADIYKFLGIGFFVYCIKNTFFRRFNTKIRITKRPTIMEVNDLLNELTVSEICHLLGFTFVLVIQMIILTVSGLYDLLLFSSLFNLIFNVYPVLLQERNKLRLKNFANHFPNERNN
jgi:hypothetical protein